MSEKQVALFKLMTGEEVLAEYTMDDEKAPEYYLLKAPRRVFIQQVGPSQFGIKMSPWIVGHPDGVFPIHSTHVVTVSVEMESQLKDGYLQQTSPIDLSASAASTKIVGV